MNILIVKLTNHDIFSGKEYHFTFSPLNFSTKFLNVNVCISIYFNYLSLSGAQIKFKNTNTSTFQRFFGNIYNDELRYVIYIFRKYFNVFRKYF